MSLKKNNIDIYMINDNRNNDKNIQELINKGLNDIEERTKYLSIKDIEIKENIRSIKLKEKKIDKINQTILNKKEELKLIKELFLLKEEKKMNIKNIIDSYLDFLLSSNDNLDNKLNSLFQKEIIINSKQKVINNLLGEDKNETDYDYIYENINRPLDISKFYIKPKKQNYFDKKNENGGDNFDEFFMNEIKNFNNNIKNDMNNNNDNINNNNNNNNLYQIKKNKISSCSSYGKISNGNKLEELPYNNSKNRIDDQMFNNYVNINRINNTFNNNKKDKIKLLCPYSNYTGKKDKILQKYIYNTKTQKKIQKPIYIKENRDSRDKSEKGYKFNNESDNYFNIVIKNEKNKTYRNDYLKNKPEINNHNGNKNVNNFARTECKDVTGYNLEPNNKLQKARIIYKRLLEKLKKSNELFFYDNINYNLQIFFMNALNSNYFLRKILCILYECLEIYNPYRRTNTETVHDSVFISKLNNNFDSDMDDINNINVYEKGLEEIKKITQETKQLQDKISQFVYTIDNSE